MNWKFTTLPQIICRQGGRHQLGDLAAALGQNVLLVTGGMTAERSVFLDDIQSAFALAKLPLHHWLQSGEPTIEDIEAGVEFALAHGADVVVAVGGGSVIDAAKAIAAVASNGGHPLDYLEVVGAGKPLLQDSLPLIAVPTTAGAGSEGTRNAVLKVQDKAVKVSMRGEQLRPRIALIDAELATTVSPEVTASTGLDCLTQLLESYTSKNAQPLSDAWALDGIRRVVQALPQAYADGLNLAAREEMLMAALLGGICLSNAGLGAVHGFAGPLGGRYPIPHGVACAALLVPVVKANLVAARDNDHESLLDRYAVLGAIFAQGLELSKHEACEKVASYCRQLVDDLSIPGLSHYGVQRDDFDEVITAAQRSSSMKYNPVLLSKEQLHGCLEMAL